MGLTQVNDRSAEKYPDDPYGTPAVVDTAVGSDRMQPNDDTF